MHSVIHPTSWLPAKGYSNGILDHQGTLHVGGQIGWNADKQFESIDFVGQTRQALRNVADVVHAAGGKVSDIVRLTWYVTDKTDYLAKQAQIGAVYREVMGRHFPAMTMVVVNGLVEDQALVEIEATAVLAPTRAA
jgi:enamine deaminase RidA (YjgF/YER057c/UK114 family)